MTDHMEKLKQLAKHSIQLSIGGEETYRPGATRFGGRPDVPSDFVWPTFKGERYDPNAPGITLSTNPCAGAQVAPQRCPILRHSQKHVHDTIAKCKFQATCRPPIMALTGRVLRPSWPGGTAICDTLEKVHDLQGFFSP